MRRPRKAVAVRRALTRHRALSLSCACAVLLLLLLGAEHARRGVGDGRNARFLDERGAPRPIFVVAGGAPRTGSTLVFNVLRVLMRVRDPNTVASSNWMLAKLVPENATVRMFDRVRLLRGLGTSVLVKVHTARQWYEFAGPANGKSFAEEVDLLVTGYRDLRAETVSMFKMFARNRTEWRVGEKWAEMCRALIRRRESLIQEAGTVVPVVDVRYEGWQGSGRKGLLKLVRRLAKSLPWVYTEHELLETLQEVQRMRVPAGGEAGNHIDWHISNLMSPRHISVEHLSEELVSMGVRAINNEPTCAAWLSEKHYV